MSAGSQTCQRRRNGFSLIELVIVIILMAILAGLASIPVRSAITRSQLSYAVEVVERFDLAMRSLAREERQRVQGSFDRARGRLSLQSSTASREFQLPRRVRLASVRIAGDTSFQTIDASPSGSTPTYAIQVTVGASSRWIVLVGGSGQVIRQADSDLVNSLMRVES